MTAGDPQLKLVCEAEHELLGLTLAVANHSALRSIFDAVMQMYDIDDPPAFRIYPRHESGHAGEVTVNGVLWLNSSNYGGSGANPITLLHELAHVVDDEYGEAEDTHGPIWAGIYRYLLAAFRVLPIDASGVIFRRHGIVSRRPQLCSPQALLRTD